MDGDNLPQENGESYQLNRADVPALLFVVSPVIGLALDAPLLWWVFAPLFWALVAVAMGYEVRRGR